MATLTKIDSNQLVEHEDQQRQQNVGQLFRQTVKENPTTSSVATEISAMITAPTTATATATATSIRSENCEKYNEIVVETLEQQLLIELNSGDKTDMIIKDDNEMMIEHKRRKMENKENMEFRQIELIYRAEGNANLVLALPQFKKVLRLPKSEKPMIKDIQQQQQQQQSLATLQTKQSTPHVVAKVNEHEEEMAMAMLEKDDTAAEVLDEKEQEEEANSLTMQYQNTSASSVVHQNAKG